MTQKKSTTLGEVKTYHKNPRKINEDELQKLQNDLEELGDLSGIVHDLNSNEIIGGNQRSKIFAECIPTITKTFDKPTKAGTVALGTVEYQKEEYAYRQVRWTEKQCEKANIVANKAGGDWDSDILLKEFDAADLAEWWFKDYELLGLGMEIEDLDFERPSFDTPDDEQPVPKDEKYFYVEFYGDPETFRELTDILGEHLKGLHEIDAKHFEHAIKTADELRKVEFK